MTYIDMTIKPAITDITIAIVRSNIDFISAYMFIFGVVGQIINA
jgi:hypothetical protein